MKKFTPIEETKETSLLLEQKPEIDNKTSFYKESLLALDGVMKAIDKRIETGYTIEKFKFLGIAIVKRVILDDYDKSKLILEKKRAELDLFEKKRYFEHWMERSVAYDKKFAQLKMECEANFDNIINYAEQARNYNIRLNDVMNAYKNDNDDIKIKVEYYLYLKQEVENAIKFGRIKVQPSTTPANNPNPQMEVVK